MIKGSTHQENIYVPNIGVSKYEKEILTGLKEEIAVQLKCFIYGISNNKLLELELFLIFMSLTFMLVLQVLYIRPLQY